MYITVKIVGNLERYSHYPLFVRTTLIVNAVAAQRSKEDVILRLQKMPLIRLAPQFINVNDLKYMECSFNPPFYLFLVLYQHQPTFR